MTGVRCLWALFFGVLAAWGAYTSVYWYKPRGRWAVARKFNFVCDVAFTCTSTLILCGILTGNVSRWMFIPFGILYAVWLFLPCYFQVVNRVTSIHICRNVAFAIIALLCFAIAGGLICTSWVGL